MPARAITLATLQNTLKALWPSRAVG